MTMIKSDNALGEQGKKHSGYLLLGYQPFNFIRRERREGGTNIVEFGLLGWQKAWDEMVSVHRPRERRLVGI